MKQEHILLKYADMFTYLRAAIQDKPDSRLATQAQEFVKRVQNNEIAQINAAQQHLHTITLHNDGTYYVVASSIDVAIDTLYALKRRHNHMYRLAVDTVTILANEITTFPSNTPCFDVNKHENILILSSRVAKFLNENNEND
jgi:hypothetical protein